MTDQHLAETAAVPLLSWPNSGSIQEQMLEVLWEEELGYEECYWHTDLPEPPLTPAEVGQAAPEAGQALKEAMQEYRLPNSILIRLDDDAKDIAREAVRSLPPEQRDALLKLLQARAPQN